MLLRFTHPAYLLLLIPALIALVASYRHVHGMMRFRKKVAFALRFGLASTLILALAGPQGRRPNEGLCTIFLLDHSDSVPESKRKQAEEFVRQAIQRLGPEDQAGLIVFGRNPVIDSAPGGKRSLGQVQSKIDPSASDLASAIRLASASFPEGKARRIVLLSDGNETRGEALEAAQVAAAEKIGLDYLLLTREEKTARAAVIDLQVPSEARAEEPFDLRVLIDSNTAQSGTLTIDRDGQIVAQIPVKLIPGKNSILNTQRLEEPGFHRYRATLTTEADPDNRNKVGMGFVAVRGKPRLLVMQQSTAKSPLAEALRGQGLLVDLVGPGGIPIKPEEFQPYDAVILNDLNASVLTSPQMKMLQAAVRDSGVGLAMIGGEHSFLPGGYYGTPVAEALPVDLNIRQRKTFPATTILIVVDASGSMAMPEDGQPKIRLAAKAAEETVRMMSPRDRVGVAGSTDGIQFVAPIQELKDKDAVITQIRKLDVGGGGIYCEPSVKFAHKQLAQESSTVRHFILIADAADTDEYGSSLAVIAKMRSEKITTSVVAMGQSTDKDVPFLKALAATGGGRFYLANKAGQLPAIVTQDSAIMGRSAIEEGVFLPKAFLGEEALQGIEPSEIPPLYAYCLTDPRPLARLGMKTHKDDPLLATWQYGLGSSLAFTSDAQARWATRWVGWDGFSRFWAQAMRGISRRSARHSYQMSVRQEGGRGIVEIHAADRYGNPLSSVDAEVKVATPSGGSVDVRVSQEAPGLFKGRFEASELGSYIVTVAEPDPNGGKRVSASGFSIPYPPEYRSYRANEPLLARLAGLSEGKALAKPEEALRPVKNPGESIQELWPFLVFLAALLLPLDVAMRRVALPIGEIFARLWTWIRIRRLPQAVPQAATLERLHRAKQKAQTPDSESPSETLQKVMSAPRTRSEKFPAAPTSTSGSLGSKLMQARRDRDTDKPEG